MLGVLEDRCFNGSWKNIRGKCLRFLLQHNNLCQYWHLLLLGVLENRCFNGSWEKVEKKCLRSLMQCSLGVFYSLFCNIPRNLVFLESRCVSGSWKNMEKKFLRCFLQHSYKHRPSHIFLWKFSRSSRPTFSGNSYRTTCVRSFISFGKSLRKFIYRNLKFNFQNHNSSHA